MAEIAKRNGINTTVLLSAYGASATSKVFYFRIRGKLEDKIASFEFHLYILFKPGLLLRKDADGPGERLTVSMLKFLNSLGLIKKIPPNIDFSTC